MNLLLTGAWAQAKENIKELEDLGHSVVFMQYEKDKLPCEYDWVEGIVCNGLFLHHQIEKFTNLRYIQLTSAGFDRVPMDYVKANNIEIHNARGVYSAPMAEFAISGVLQLYKQVEFFRENQRNHVWEKHRGLLELTDKNVLVVGCGSVGNECAKRFRAFDCNVYGVDLYPREDEFYKAIYPLDELNNAIQLADIIVLTLPLTEQTKYLINEEKFSLMKQGAVLVNIARGAVVDTDALLENIDKLGGAVLDVFEEEPLNETSPLWDNKKIILTPHNSFVGDRVSRRLKMLVFDNLMK